MWRLTKLDFPATAVDNRDLVVSYCRFPIPLSPSDLKAPLTMSPCDKSEMFSYKAEAVSYCGRTVCQLIFNSQDSEKVVLMSNCETHSVSEDL